MKWFKKYFVPHRGNAFTPHLFKEAGLTVLYVSVVALFALAVSGRYILTRTDLTALVLPKVLVDYANDDRSAQHYGQLTVNPILEKAAQLKANDMAEKGYFAHKSPDGKTPWYWFEQAGYDFTYAGENLAVNFDDSTEVNKAWMNSPGHRANIMNSNFTEIGIATAEGMYQGRRTVFVVQLFGRPAAKDLATAQAKAVKSAPSKTSGTVAKSTSTEAVLGASISTEQESVNGQNDLYISVKKTSAVEAASTATPASKQSNAFEKILVSPGKVLQLCYLVIAGLILLALLIMLFVEIKRQNPKYILLALGMILIISGLMYVYHSMLFAPLLIV